MFLGWLGYTSPDTHHLLRLEYFQRLFCVPNYSLFRNAPGILFIPSLINKTTFLACFKLPAILKSIASIDSNLDYTILVLCIRNLVRPFLVLSLILGGSKDIFHLLFQLSVLCSCDAAPPVDLVC